MGILTTRWVWLGLSVLFALLAVATYPRQPPQQQYSPPPITVAATPPVVMPNGTRKFKKSTKHTQAASPVPTPYTPPPPQPSAPPPRPPTLQEIRPGDVAGKTFLFRLSDDFVDTSVRISRTDTLIVDANGRFSVKWADHVFNAVCSKPNFCMLAICPLGAAITGGGDCHFIATRPLQTFAPVSEQTSVLVKNGDVDPLRLHLFFMTPNMYF
jgi:hypothetical protein